MPRKAPSRRAQGSAIIEFALSISVLWMLFYGVFQFGYGFYQYNKLQTFVSQAALFAAQYSFDMDNPNTYTTAVKNMVIYGDPAGGTRPIVKGLTMANVVVSINPLAGVPTDITVRINNYPLGTVFKTFTLVNKPRVSVSYMGRVICTTCL